MHLLLLLMYYIIGIFVTNLSVPVTLASPVVMDNAVISWTTVQQDRLRLMYELEFEGGHCGMAPKQMLYSNHSSHLEPGSLLSINVSAATSQLGLDRGASYTVRVRGVNAFTSGEWSEGTRLQTQRIS